jgi:hypothetical protein
MCFSGSGGLCVWWTLDRALGRRGSALPAFVSRYGLGLSLVIHINNNVRDSVASNVCTFSRAPNDPAIASGKSMCTLNEPRTLMLNNAGMSTNSSTSQRSTSTLCVMYAWTF